MEKDEGYIEAEKRIETAYHSEATKLDLSALGLKKVPETISKLSNLQLLFLYNNEISEIPESITSLSKLQDLYLNSNQISEIPDSIASLSNLQKLYLSKNQISGIPDNIASLSNLQELYLSDNQISEIPDNIGYLSNLQRLNLYDNLNSEIPESITSLSNLQELFLSHNQILEIPDCIQNLSNLIRFFIPYNRINFVNYSVLKLPKLRDFSFDGNYLSLDSPFNTLGLAGVLQLIHDQEKEQITSRIFKIHESLRTTFQQYLNFFDEYVKETKGKIIPFKVNKVEEGLEISTELEDTDVTLEQVDEWLAEYWGLIKETHPDLKSKYKTEGNEIARGFFELEMKNQIINLKQAVMNWQEK